MMGGWRSWGALRLEKKPAVARQVVGSNPAPSTSHPLVFDQLNPDFPAWASGYKLLNWSSTSSTPTSPLGPAGPAGTSYARVFPTKEKGFSPCNVLGNLLPAVAVGTT